MKKLLILLFISTGVIAQNPNLASKNHEKIKALKTAHITQQLELTPSEAEKFWPIFNDFDAKIMELRKKDRNEILSKIKDGGVDSLTENEANEIIDKMMEIKSTELEYRKQLIKDLRGVIPPVKIIKLRKAEESFKRMLLERLKQRKGQRKP